MPTFAPLGYYLYQNQKRLSRQDYLTYLQELNRDGGVHLDMKSSLQLYRPCGLYVFGGRLTKGTRMLAWRGPALSCVRIIYCGTRLPTSQRSARYLVRSRARRGMPRFFAANWIVGAASQKRLVGNPMSTAIRGTPMPLASSTACSTRPVAHLMDANSNICSQTRRRQRRTCVTSRERCH